MKDVGIALDLARTTGATMPVLELFAGFFKVLNHQKR